MKPINIFVTLDETYLPHVKVMLKSLYASNPGERFHIYLAYDSISQAGIESLSRFCGQHNSVLYAIAVDENIFADAPVTQRLPQAMYYRLLAHQLLPHDLDRALYLDPDIIVINPIRALYDMPLGRYSFAAAMHTGVTGIAKPLNQVRLQQYETAGYYNTGVLLLNLERHREEINQQDIFRFIRDHRFELLLPDQDVFNALYGSTTLPLDDSLYNYDARRYETHHIVSGGEKDLDWVMNNTVILHFCGRTKPWIKSHRSRFGILYKHYAAMVAIDEC